MSKSKTFSMAENMHVSDSKAASVGRGVLDPPQTLALIYDADGNMTGDGTYAYSYDAENRLKSITSAVETNGAIRILNAYDHRNRRIRKIVQQLHSTSAPPPAPPSGTDEWLTLQTHTFVWDGNNIILEKVEFADGTTSTFEYFWGLDKSGTEQGAGGVGGLLAVSNDGVFYIPCYDHNGNIALYVSETGAITAQYTYDPYGNIIESSGSLANEFSFGFSTKYHDRGTGMIGYQQRVYLPVLGRWINRDPIEEDGGANLYCFVRNGSSYRHDYLGLSFGTIGPNAGSFTEIVGKTQMTYGSDLWFAVYGDSKFNMRRRIKFDICPCDGGKKNNKTYDYFSIPGGSMYFGKGEVSDGKWVGDNIIFSLMNYAEVISLPECDLWDMKGTVDVLVQLTSSNVKPSDTKPKVAKGEGFGTENNFPYGDMNSKHPVENFVIESSDWQPQNVVAEISFTVVLKCGELPMLKAPPKKTGDWGLDSENFHRSAGKGLPPRKEGRRIPLM